MSSFFQTRFAPTPSGYLHLGNICNLLLIHCYKKQLNLNLRLRVDDIDRSRFRLEYLEDIFRVSEFLGVSFDSGPSDVNDFEQNYSQRKKIEKYRSYLELLKPHTFICECTRKRLKDTGSVYPGFCRNKVITHDNNLKTRLAVHSREVELGSFDNINIAGRLDALIGDFILWNSLEDRPSYQLVSLVEDLEDQVDLIIRGKDLSLSTISQEVIRNVLITNKGPSSKHKNISYIHHALITKDSQKISKSVSKNSPVPITERFSTEEVYSYFWSWVSGEKKMVKSLSELESLYIERNLTPSFESVKFK